MHPAAGVGFAVSRDRGDFRDSNFQRGVTGASCSSPPHRGVVMSEIPQRPEWKCMRARDSMALHADGDLSPDQAEWLLAHLENCADCRRAATDFTAIDRELIGLGQSLDARNKRSDARER